MGFDYQAVSGDYQFKALRSGPRMQRFWHRGKLALVDHLFRTRLARGSDVLEIGCGSGNLLVRAATGGSFPVAFDLALASLQFVRARLQQISGPEQPRGFACIGGSSEQLPFAASSFDGVLLSEVIEHLEAPQLTVREAARVLRPGGCLLVTTPNYRSLWPALEWSIDRLSMAPKMAGEQHIAQFRPDSLRRLLVESGLTLDYFGTIYGASPFLALVSQSWADRRLARELRRRSLLRMILVAIAVKRATAERPAAPRAPA